MLRDFEVKKRDVATDNNNRVTIRLPLSLKELFEDEKKDLRHAIKQTRYADKMVLAGDKLRIDASVMKNPFDDAIQSIVSHLKEMMTDGRIRGISSILMVGGFSESKMLQGAIKSNFPDVKVVVPHEAGLIVLKEAVTTLSQFHSVSANKIHDVRKRNDYEDGPYCTDLFSKYVEVGQTISLDETTEEQSYTPVRENQTSVDFYIYASTKTSPMYVTDEGCVKLGKVTVDILDKSVPRDERSVLVSVTFGGTEIVINAREKRTGKATKGTMDFLG